MNNFAAWLLEGKESSPATALLEGEARMTFADLHARMTCVAARVSRSGDSPIVPVLGRSSMSYASAYLGVLHAGAVPALVPALSDAGLGAVFQQTRPQLILADETSAEQARALGATNVVDLDEAAASPERRAAAARVDAGRMALLFYTSGTTAEPKGVMLTTDNLRANAEAILSFLPLAPDDRAFLSMPLSYCYGASVLHTHLRAGASVFFHDVRFAEPALDALAGSGATGLPGVPSLLQLLVSGGLSERHFQHVRWIMSSGGSLPERAVSELSAALPRAQIFLRYGVTEFTAAASCLPPERLRDKPGSIGRGLSDAPLRVERLDGTTIPPGSEEVGEIVLAGPHLSLGYFADPAETERRFAGRRFRTGDLARVDGDGFVYLVARATEFIKSGGHRIAPAEIEEVIGELPSVADVAVVAEPDPRRGDAIVALVVLQTGGALTLYEMREHCASRLPSHKVPSKVRFVAAIPRTSSGKISRRALATVATMEEHDHADAQ
jgi:acyl-CoA synthetase (AMP-forming)/AMP-acid ligase II